MMTIVPSGKLRILIAEDNEADVLLIEEALREHGLNYEAEVANNGEQAFAFLHRLEGSPNLPLHLVVLDLNLTTHHGTEVLAQIRKTPGLVEVAVVVLTSSDSSSDRQRVQALGADLYIRKPMDLDSFLKIGGQIAEVLRRRGPLFVATGSS